MQKIQVPFFCEDSALKPTVAYSDDACWDLKIPKDVTLIGNSEQVVELDLILAIPAGWEGVIRGRSGHGFKRKIKIFQEGTIDAGYRNKIGIHLQNTTNSPQSFLAGTAMAQIAFREVPEVELVEVLCPGELPEAHRGLRGFGSSDA